MIKVVISGDGAEVTGDKGDLAMFHAAWQTKLWPDWMQYYLDHDIDEVNEAMTRIQNEGKILYHDPLEENDISHGAVMFAIAFCRKLGILVQ